MHAAMSTVIEDSTMNMSGRPKLLYFVTEDWYFCSHRLPLAVAARNAGYDVAVVTRVCEHGDVIRDAGLKLLPFDMRRGGLNPFREFDTVMRLMRLYRREAPALVHHVAMKPVLYGSLAARLAGVPLVVNTLAGMGWLFSSAGNRAYVLKWYVRELLRLQLRNGITVVQNPDDVRLLLQLGIDESHIRHIAGSGVDLSRFRPGPEPDGVPVVVLPARLLWNKGVGEYVDAARLLRKRGIKARFILAGKPDAVNPSSIDPRQIAEWADEGVVECPGWVNDMPQMLAESHIVCLPSYREGLPKSLIEASAAGRAIVTTDVPGCHDVVRDGDNGLLVPPNEVVALADALQCLIEDRELRIRMGERGRIRAEQEFGLEHVIPATLDIYSAMPAAANTTFV
jgi:glycosyltransferase involved in cell wall biosynthesis